MNRKITRELTKLAIFALVNAVLGASAQDGKLLESSPVTLAVSNIVALEKHEPDLRAVLDKIEINSISYLSDGLKVKGYLVLPKRGTNLPCIIYNRGGNLGFGALTDSVAAARLGQMASWGYVVVGSQYRGNEGGEGKEEFGGRDVDDVLNLLPLLGNTPRADASRVGIYGRSRGGMMTYLALTRTDKIAAAVVDAGLADCFETTARRPDMETVFADLVPNYNQTKAAALEARSAVRWPERLNQRTPILLLQGTSDWRVSPLQAIQMATGLYQCKHPFRLVMFEGGDHGLTEHRIEADRIIREWLDRYVRDRLPWPSLEPHGE